MIGEINDAQKPDFLSGAVGLLMPIDWPEPFGLVMIEAMACGTPVIAFNRGSVPEIVEDGVSGFIVEDETGAIAAVSRLAELSRDTVRARFDARFTAQRMAEDYLTSTAPSPASSGRCCAPSADPCHAPAGSGRGSASRAGMVDGRRGGAMFHPGPLAEDDPMTKIQKFQITGLDGAPRVASIKRSLGLVANVLGVAVHPDLGEVHVEGDADEHLIVVQLANDGIEAHPVHAAPQHHPHS